jgi:mannose-6-phosphate isomerase-like protein (cupin superfamily)
MMKPENARTAALVVAATSWLASCGAPRTAPPPPEAPVPAAPAPAVPEPPATAATAAPDPAPLGKLPDVSDAALAQSAVCRQDTCSLGKWLPDPAFATTGPERTPTPLSLWLHELHPNTRLDVPRHADLDLIALVLGGRAVLSSEDVAETALEPWTAAYVPGVGCSLRAGTSAVKLVVALVARKGTVSDAAVTAMKAGQRQFWQKRPGSVETADLSSARDLAWGNGAFHARIAFAGEGGSERPSSLEILMTAPDAAIPEHDHPSWEHIAILRGEGTFRMGSVETNVKPGVIFQIPPGVKHAFTARGQNPVLGVQLYSPSGPEQRFVELAGAGKGTK